MKKFRIIKDSIYGHVKIPNLCCQFMDQPEFQRLRNVRQLGLAHYVYPSASHTRFEHSIGVMHLAGVMMSHLDKNPTKRTTELVQLAGMYHDIGHLAYSHLFDVVLHECKSQNIPDFFKLRNHEERSIYFLRKVNTRLNLLNEEECKFVQDVILGIGNGFMYQIINNKLCGLDVDKMDYLQRDAYHTGFQALQSDYTIMNSFVFENQICFLPRVKRDIEMLFETRKTMHINVYQHHTVKKLDKIYFCCMQGLKDQLFQYGEKTDDNNINTLIRNCSYFDELMLQIDTRRLNHECSRCERLSCNLNIVNSGDVSNVLFKQS